MSEHRYIIVEHEDCQSCIFYRQHYILLEHCRPMPLHYGHCVHGGRTKKRTPDETCTHREQA